jgi:3',5'-cyclic AMP phosphodiesterase CpdA
MPEVNLFHISDTHIVASRTLNKNKNSTQIKLAKSLKKFVDDNNNFDMNIITGDITSDDNNEDALENARDFLFSDYVLKTDGNIGLNLNPTKTIIVPGNHDLDNDFTSDLREWWKESISSFTSTFSEIRAIIPSENNGITFYHTLINTIPLLFVVLDTSYLSGSDNDRGRGTSKRQREKLLNDQISIMLSSFTARNGFYEFENNNQTIKISKEEYDKTIKILVMHHFLFDPSNINSKKNLSIKVTTQRNLFKNLLLSDFNVILCGHKHRQNESNLLDIEAIDYRSKRRFYFDILRDKIGYNHKFFQINDKENQQLSKSSSLILLFIAAYAEDPNFVKLIKKSFQDIDFKNKFHLPNEFVELILNNDLNAITSLEDKKLDLYNYLCEKLDNDIVQKIKLYGKPIVESLESEFKKRDIVQISAGASIYDNQKTKSKRFIKTIKIVYDKDGYKIISSTFELSVDKIGYSEISNDNSEILARTF